MILLPHFTRSLLLRTLLIWAFARVCVMLASAGAAAALRLPPPPNPWLLTPRAAELVVALAAVVVMVSIRRRNEDLFLLTLGYGRARQVAAVVLPLLLIELTLGIALRV